MKDFNTELNKDINRLIQLHALKDKSAFNALKNEIMLKHSISKATVYREMKKDTPGLYKKPCYNPPERPITEKEIAMVTELLLRKIPVMDLARILEAETGNKYNWDRIDKIRSIINARHKSDEKGTLSPERVTVFGDETKRLCSEALKFNYMAPDAYIEFTAGETKYRLCYADIKDIVAICANAAQRASSGYDDYTTFVRDKIWNLMIEKIRLIRSAAEVSTKELMALKEAFEEFEESHMSSFCRNFSVIWYVANEIACTYGVPDLSYSKVYELTQKHSALFPECKINECECLKELKKSAAA